MKSLFRLIDVDKSGAISERVRFQFWDGKHKNTISENTKTYRKHIKKAQVLLSFYAGGKNGFQALEKATWYSGCEYYQSEQGFILEYP